MDGRCLYLWQRAVELMDGVHHIQQHVVANHKFTLCVRWNGLEDKSDFPKPTITELWIKDATIVQQIQSLWNETVAQQQTNKTQNYGATQD